MNSTDRLFHDRCEADTDELALIIVGLVNK
jgi:hypothetical protein